MNYKLLLIFITVCSFAFAPDIKAQQEVDVNFNCVDGTQGSLRCIQFTVDKIDELLTLQGTIGYNPKVYKFNSALVAGSCFPFIDVNAIIDNGNGSIGFTWYDIAPFSNSTECELFTICFDLIGNPGDSSFITLTNNVTEIDCSSDYSSTVKVNFNTCFGKILPTDFVVIPNQCPASSAASTDGSLSFYGTGGKAPYNYDVTGPVNFNGSAGENQTIKRENLPLGNYSIKFTDADGIMRIRVQQIDVGDKPTFDLIECPQSCFTKADGRLTVKNVKVFGNPIIEWSNQAFNIDSITNLAIGKYSVSVTDDVTGCTVSKETTLKVDTLRMQISIIDSAMCNGLKDGIIRIKASGGTMKPGDKYGIALNTNGFVANTDSIYTWINAVGGTVKIKVKDNAFSCFGITDPCIIEQTVKVPVKKKATYDVLNIADVKCFGDKTGQISIMPAGTGTSFTNFIYKIPQTTIYPGGVNGPMGLHFNNELEIGDYLIATRSNTGCLDTFRFSIAGPASRFVVQSSFVSPGCSPSGTITLTPNGGQLPYTYKWNDNINTKDRSNLVAGNYSVTVTDAASCDTVLNFILDGGANSLNIDAVIQKAITCRDASNGEITVNITGNAPSPVFNWQKASTGQTWNTRVVTALSSGLYYVTVTSNGCVDLDTIFLPNPDGLVIKSTEVIDPLCPRGGFKGSLGITMEGGSPSYNYEWKIQGQNNILGTQSVLPNLDPGVYTIKVSDANGCSKDTVLTVKKPQDFTINFSNKADISCFGISDGRITAAAALGPVNNGQYKFFWSNGRESSGAFNPDINNQLPAGENWVLVADSKCLSDTFKFTIGGKPKITANFTSTGICGSECTGRVDVTASGGTGTLTLTFQNVSSAWSVFNLCAGTYPFIVRDAAGCTLLDTAIVSSTDTIFVKLDSVLTEPLSCKNAVGQLAVNVNGGVSPYTYKWSGTNSTTNIAKDLNAGTYNVTVTDDNGCAGSLTYTFIRPNPISADIPPPPQPNCFGGKTCIKVNSVTGGSGSNYSLQINNSIRIPIDSCYSVFAGKYLVSVFDGSGCKVNYPIEIGQPDQIVVNLGDDIEVNLGQEIPDIIPDIQSNTIINNYFWTGVGDLLCIDTICSALTGIPKNDLDIRLVATDENGCTGFDEINVRVKDERKVYFANIFKTTSADEQNRKFDVKTGFGVEVVSDFTIYDRWGAIVYVKKNYLPEINSGWDGLINGIQALPGVYVYNATIKFIDGEIKTYKGDVLLIK